MSLKDEIRRGLTEQYGGVTDRETLRKLVWLRFRYERLSRQIDAKYATGRTRGVEDLEVEAERILEEMDSYSHLLAEGAEELVIDQEYDLVHHLAVTYLGGPEKFSSFDDWINNMRHAIIDSIRGWGQLDPSSAQVLEIAKDAAFRWKELRARYRGSRR